MGGREGEEGGREGGREGGWEGGRVGGREGRDGRAQRERKAEIKNHDIVHCMALLVV